MRAKKNVIPANAGTQETIALRELLLFEIAYAATQKVTPKKAKPYTKVFFQAFLEGGI